MYILYSAALAMALAIASPYWLWQALRHGKYRAGFRERLGRVPQRLRGTRPDENCIWIHAVSLGEVMAISDLARELIARFGPGWRIVISTTTLTGQKLARQRFGDDNVFYLPLDFALFLRPFFRFLRPRALLLAETEFWPNLLQVAVQQKVRMAVVNARISDRSFPRYFRLRTLLSKAIRPVDMFLAQSEADRERLVRIGAPANRVQISGNLKFEVSSPKASELVSALKAAIPVATPVFVAGSTVEGEEPLVLDGFRSLLRSHPQAVMILAPRHPERFSSVADTLRQSQLPYIKRSEWKAQPLQGGVLLLDTIGELASLYELATAAFVGGSLVPAGGHNILEPARFGKPVFVGPHTQNFRDIISIFQRADAVHVLDVNHPDAEFATFFDDKWRAMGQRALQVLNANSGALQKTVDALEVLLWMPSTIKDRYQKVAE